MKIGILQAGHFPEQLHDSMGDYGDLYVRFLDGFDFEFEIFSVVDNEFPEDAHSADGWLISGSKHGAYEDHAWIPPLEQLIRDIRDAGKPLVGICFGHQIIAQALGGTVKKFDGGWSVGATEYDFNGDKLTLNAWHGDQVITAPEGAQIEASTDFCTYAALSYGDKIYTVQPHPEFNAAAVAGLIKYRGDGIAQKDLLQRATKNLDQHVSNDVIARKMAHVLTEGRIG